MYSSGLDGSLALDLTDASGRQSELALGSLSTAGWSRLSASTAGLPLPLRLRAVRISLAGERASGDVALADVEGSGGAVIESFATAAGWWQEAVAPNPAAGPLLPSTVRPDAGRPTLDVPVDHAAVLVEPPPASAPLPVLLANPTMAALGLSIGQAFPLHVNTVDVQLVPVGSFDLFPTFYPGQESLIVAPLASLLGRLGHAGDPIPWADELWVGPGPDVTGVTARIHADLNVQAVLVRSTAEAAALGDPLQVGLRDELGLGFLVALAVVVLGFALHFLAAARTRATQFAIMRANGVPQAAIRASLVWEQAVVLAAGLIAGTAIGLALAWAVVPLFHVGTLPADLTPPTLLRLDVLTLVGVVAGTGAVAAGVGWLVARAGSRVDVMATLRLLS